MSGQAIVRSPGARGALGLWELHLEEPATSGPRLFGPTAWPPRADRPTLAHLRDAAGETVDEVVFVADLSLQRVALSTHGGAGVADAVEAALRGLGFVLSSGGAGAGDASGEHAAWTAEERGLERALRCARSEEELRRLAWQRALCSESLWHRLLSEGGPSGPARAAWLQTLLRRSRVLERLREPVRVVLIGAPNAGKSTLLNVLAADERALVSPEAGTTRDVVEVELNLEGLPFMLSDLAGLREAEAWVEREGIRRARALVANAGVRVLVADGRGDPQALVAWLADQGLERSALDLLVLSHADLAWKHPKAHWAAEVGLAAYALAGPTGEGRQALARAIRYRSPYTTCDAPELAALPTPELRALAAAELAQHARSRQGGGAA